jgi:uncharacterized membrane protein
MFVYSCETSFEGAIQVCPDPCYSNDFVLFYFDWLFNTIFPVVIIVVANITLIYRVIRSMRRIRRRRSRMWKKQRKLTLQLLAFSSLYVLGWGPSTLVSIIQTFFLPNLYEDAPKLYYINNSSYFVCPLQPFICLFALPELMNFIKSKFGRGHVVTSAVPSMTSG